MHKNEGYDRQSELKLIRPEIKDEDLFEKYEDMLKFNNQICEMNYMVEIYHAFQNIIGGINSEMAFTKDAWIGLFQKYDTDPKDNLLNKNELKKMIMSNETLKCKTSDADVNFVFVNIASFNKGGVGKHITP